MTRKDTEKKGEIKFLNRAIILTDVATRRIFRGIATAVASSAFADSDAPPPTEEECRNKQEREREERRNARRAKVAVGRGMETGNYEEYRRRLH